MKKYVIYPVAAHILLSFIGHMIYRCTWGGAEGGYIFMCFPEIDKGLIFFISVFMELAIACAYFYIGRKLPRLAKVTFLGVGSVVVLNLACIAAFCLMGYDISGALKLFGFFCGSSFFLIYIMGGASMWVSTVIIFIPAVLMLAGNCVRYRVHK